MLKKLLCCVSVCLTVVSMPLSAADWIVAVVNNEVITNSELEQQLSLTREQLQQQRITAPPAAQLQRQVLERMVQQKIEIQAARDIGMRVGDGELEAALTRVPENNKMTMAQLRAAVTKSGLDWNAYREEIRNQMTLGRLREREISVRVKISDAELDAYLALEGRGENGREYRISHILLRAPENASVGQWNALQARANEVLVLSSQGDDFPKLVAAYSQAQDAMSGGISRSTAC